MTLTLLFFGLFAGTLGPQNVQIYDVPTPGAPAVKSRFRLCPNASAESGVSRANDTRASIEQLFGTLTSVEIHQFGQSFLTSAQSRRTFVDCSRRDLAKYLAINRG